MPSTDDERLPPLDPALLDDSDDLADAIARRVTQIEPDLAETAVLESALDLVKEQLDGGGRDALALALTLLDERRDALLALIVRAAILETVAAVRDADGVLRDEEQRAWWIDAVLRSDPEVRRVGTRLRRREDDLRQAMGEELWRSLFLPTESRFNEYASAGQDAIVLALIRGHPAPERRRE